jgi:hypothetical protein
MTDRRMSRGLRGPLNLGRPGEEDVPVGDSGRRRLPVTGSSRGGIFPMLRFGAAGREEGTSFWGKGGGGTLRLGGKEGGGGGGRRCLAGRRRGLGEGAPLGWSAEPSSHVVKFSYWKLLLTVIFESISFTVIYVLSDLLFATFIFSLKIVLVYSFSDRSFLYFRYNMGVIPRKKSFLKCENL